MNVVGNDLERCIGCGTALPGVHAAEGVCLRCRTTCLRKNSYADRSAALDALEWVRRQGGAPPSLQIYHCRLGPHFHLGNSGQTTRR